MPVVEFSKVIYDAPKIAICIDRLCKQLIEVHGDFSTSVLIGLQPRGIALTQRIFSRLSSMLQKEINWSALDVSMYRDDFRHNQKYIEMYPTSISVNLDNKKVILIDDVLFTGRTIRSGLDALLDFGRPASVELLVLIQRNLSLHFPIAPTYIGKRVDTLSSQSIRVQWQEKDGIDQVILIDKKW
ncbi:MAG: bifunctional pyr operon transcriptional regulator/uracil phosphoribosyltransferase PyrR [Chitinophagales bacterium]|nr:bifunctional pyr operon transcriptional regulator/uracil phosphoribosyltransferase PyrR [Bacteroidota bacterium]MCB9042648.1 bifunctional pyr operon transcriptional regulator/uracil phosphoribosyltransferase PyrR [Chitinophagales bacterium]